MYMDTYSLLTSQNSSIAQICVPFLKYTCMLGRGWQAHQHASKTWQLFWSHQSRKSRSCCSGCRLPSAVLRCQSGMSGTAAPVCVRVYSGCQIHWANWETANGFLNERKYDSSQEICGHGCKGVSAELYSYVGHLAEWAQQDGASVVTDIPSDPSFTPVLL